MANLNVSYADMESAAANLRAGQADLEAQLQKLRSQIASLVSSGFVTDKASKSFDSNYEQFTQGATKCVQGIDGLAKSLETMAKTFAETDTAMAK